MDARDAVDISEEHRQRLIDYLQRQDTQERVRVRMRTARERATVTISRAARLFDLSEQQLRDWEKRGLLMTERPLSSSQDDGKNTPGHRQYALEELDKLALIKELLEGGFTPGEIPTNIKTLWSSLDEEQGQLLVTFEQAQHVIESQYASMSIDQRIESARELLFWRYFVSHILRLILLLIHEDNLGTYIGLILPLQENAEIRSIQSIRDVGRSGESLVGWLSQSLSSHTLLTPRPSFRYESEFSLVPLRNLKSATSQRDTCLDNVFIVVKRNKAASLTLDQDTIATIDTLLQVIYQNVEICRACFGLMMNDVLESAPHVSDVALYPDLLLNGMADMIMRLGNNAEGKGRWLFSCILAPKKQPKPLQQRGLVVLAQSKKSPYKIGVTDVIPDEADLNGLSLRAFQSGRVVYRPIVLPKDVAVAYRDQEAAVRSAVAIPIGGEGGEPVASLYVASEQADAFSEHDKRVLRMMGRIIEEILRTYSIRQREGDRLRDIIHQVDDIDSMYSDFLSENQFIHDVEETLTKIKMRLTATEETDPLLETAADTQGEEEREVISIIAIDVDNTGEYATKYGDQMVRNLCREVGVRVKGELNASFDRYISKLYHIYTDRFYVLLWNIPYKRLMEKARLLKRSMRVGYKVSVLPTEDIQIPPPGTMIDVDDATVRFAISSYSRQTIEELLKKYPDDVSVPTLRQTMERALTAQLKKGMDSGGDCIIGWDPELRGYKELSIDD